MIESNPATDNHVPLLVSAVRPSPVSSRVTRSPERCTHATERPDGRGVPVRAVWVRWASLMCSLFRAARAGRRGWRSTLRRPRREPRR
ncbi:hypothetical protein AAV33_08300 [Corynebacterium otitidis]|nr:hypothetical protein AAV33_08300 [Corynebacterium otitidis]